MAEQNFFINQSVYSCKCCGKKEKCFFPQEKFDYMLVKNRMKNDEAYYNFCNLDCLRKWLEEENE